jgi:hypothetical protein
MNAGINKKSPFFDSENHIQNHPNSKSLNMEKIKAFENLIFHKKENFLTRKGHMNAEINKKPQFFDSENYLQNHPNSTFLRMEKKGV